MSKLESVRQSERRALRIYIRLISKSRFGHANRRHNAISAVHDLWECMPDPHVICGVLYDTSTAIIYKLIECSLQYEKYGGVPASKPREVLGLLAWLERALSERRQQSAVLRPLADLDHALHENLRYGLGPAFRTAVSERINQAFLQEQEEHGARFQTAQMLHSHQIAFGKPDSRYILLWLHRIRALEITIRRVDAADPVVAAAVTASRQIQEHRNGATRTYVPFALRHSFSAWLEFVDTERHYSDALSDIREYQNNLTEAESLRFPALQDYFDILLKQLDTLQRGREYFGSLNAQADGIWHEILRRRNTVEFKDMQSVGRISNERPRVAIAKNLPARTDIVVPAGARRGAGPELQRTDPQALVLESLRKFRNDLDELVRLLEIM